MSVEEARQAVDEQQPHTTLFAAAELLRWRAKDLTKGWFDADVDLRSAIAEKFHGNVDTAWDDARWIAMMSPEVGLVLATVFEQWARMVRLDPGLIHRVGGKETLALAKTLLEQ